MQEYIYNTDQPYTTTTTIVEEPKFEPYPLLTPSNPIMKTKAENFDFSSVDLIPEEIASRLIETANLHKVFGITANQCGLPLNLFVAGSDDNFVAFFNAEILLSSSETKLAFEIDASNPGLMLNIKRPTSINVQYQDYTGELKVSRFDGITARVIQQCIDRLNGIDFKSNVSQFSLSRQQKALSKKVKKVIKSSIRQGIAK